MISKADILAAVANLRRATTDKPLQRRFVNPKREWFWIVTTTIVLLGLAVALVTLQTSFLRNPTVEVVNTQTVTAYDEQQTKRVVATYEAALLERTSYRESLAASNAGAVGNAATSSSAVATTTSTTSISSSPDAAPVSAPALIEMSQ